MQVHQLKEENEALKAEIQSLKRLQEEHSYLTEAGKMVKRLKRILNNVEKKQDDPVIACTKVRLLCAASCFPLFFGNIVYST